MLRQEYQQNSHSVLLSIVRPPLLLYVTQGLLPVRVYKSTIPVLMRFRTLFAIASWTSRKRKGPQVQGGMAVADDHADGEENGDLLQKNISRLVSTQQGAGH